jgi:hypothetical protein
MRPARSTRPAIAAIAAVALAGAGCGATPPQAPLHQAARLGVATGDISTACGEATQLQQFPPAPAKEMRTLEATAAAAARKLAGIYRRNQSWVYEGTSVATIVRQAEAMLSGCGLTGAETALRRAVRGS